MFRRRGDSQAAATLGGLTRCKPVSCWAEKCLEEQSWRLIPPPERSPFPHRSIAAQPNSQVAGVRVIDDHVETHGRQQLVELSSLLWRVLAESNSPHDFERRLSLQPSSWIAMTTGVRQGSGGVL